MASLRDIKRQERIQQLREAAEFSRYYDATVTEDESRYLVPMFRYGYELFQLTGRGQHYRIADSLDANRCRKVRLSVVQSLLSKGLIESTVEMPFYGSRVAYKISQTGLDLVSELYRWGAVVGNEINRRSRANPTYIRENA